MSGDLASNSGRAFYAGLLEALTQVMGTAKGYLYNHGPRVAHISLQIAREMGLSEHDIAKLMFAAVLSDTGMIGLAEDAWENPVPHLDEETRGRVRIHPVRSEAAVTAIPHLEGIAPLVRHHHEGWDGSGYPDGLVAESIPFGARILAVADNWDALTSDRPYRKGMSHERAIAILRDGAGKQWDPRIVDALVEHLTATEPARDAAVAAPVVPATSVA